jgi:tRNA 2-thiouridine synthesizing protein E
LKLILDKYGFLVDASSWDESVMQHFAKQKNLTLSDKHIALVTTLREFYLQHKRHTSMRILVKHLREKQLIENTQALYELFGEHPQKTMSLLAGLPKPPHCV